MIPTFLSPLRYPGGKASLAPFLATIVKSQPRRIERYLEPFAGGAGAALRLLIDEYVDEVVLNDLDPGIAAFWRAILYRTPEFKALVRDRPLSVEEWQRQHEVYLKREEDDLQLGFAAFYLNRTNRSGILTARPIGGLSQTGRWDMSARFNRDDLLDRIDRLARYRNRISIEERDGIEFVQAHGRETRSFLYIDPPYIKKGADLYLNTMSWADHQRLAELLGFRRQWVLTYDTDPRVPNELYADQRVVSFGIAHTAAKQSVGREYAIFSSDLVVPSLQLLGWQPVSVS